METLAGLLELAFLVSFIVAIVYGVKWFKQRKDKESDQFKKSKKKFIITCVVVVCTFIFGGMAQNSADEAEEQAETAQQQKKNKSNYKDDKEEFATYGITLNFIDTVISPYSQLYTEEFISHLSIIDVLMNNTKEEVNHLLDSYLIIH